MAAPKVDYHAMSSKLDELIAEDLNAVLALLAVKMEAVRKADDGAKVIEAAKVGADALRLEAVRWQRVTRNGGKADPLAAFREAAK